MFAALKRVARPITRAILRFWPWHRRPQKGQFPPTRHPHSDLWTIFGSGGYTGFAPRRPGAGFAVLQPHGIPLHTGLPPATDLEGAVRKVRRAAVADTFEVLGLDYMPASLWHCVDRSEDVGDGIRTYLTALGLRTDKIREKRKAEIDRANDVLGLIVEIQGSFELLPLSVAHRLADELFSGDFKAVRRAAKAAACASRIRATGQSWRESVQLPVPKSLADRIQQVLTDPFSLEEEALVELDAEWRTLVRLLLAYEHAQLAAQAVRGESSATGAPELLSQFDALDAALRTDDFSLGGSDPIVKELDELGRRLARLIPNRNESWSGEPDHPLQSPPSELEAAASLLSLNADRSLSRRAILDAYRAYLRAHQLDLGSQEFGELERLGGAAQSAMRARDFLLASL